jgi:hypothetical protein
MQPLRCKFNVVGEDDSDDDVGVVDDGGRSTECGTTGDEGVYKSGLAVDSFDDPSNISAHKPIGRLSIGHGGYNDRAGKSCGLHIVYVRRLH